MRVIHPRAALLSDYEVLSLLQDMEAEQKSDAKRRTPAIFGTPVDALDCASSDPSGLNSLAPATSLSTTIGASSSSSSSAADTNSSLSLQPPNLRSIQADTLLYLQAEHKPCVAAAQNAQSIHAFIKALMKWEREEELGDKRLTKGERLMCVNLAPRTIVELHCVVEELSERLNSEQMEHLLWLISVHFPLQGAPAPTSYDPSNGPYHPEHAHAHASEDVEQVEQSDPLTPAEQSRQLRDNHRARSAAQRQHYDRIEADGELEDELLNGYEEEEDAEDELIDAAPEADGARGQEEEM